LLKIRNYDKHFNYSDNFAKKITIVVNSKNFIKKQHIHVRFFQ
jgi:hypothetical protein